VLAHASRAILACVRDALSRSLCVCLCVCVFWVCISKVMCVTCMYLHVEVCISVYNMCMRDVYVYILVSCCVVVSMSHPRVW